MAQDENRVTESNSNINVISELPGRPFSITMEVPMFFTLMGVSLSGVAISNIILFRTCVHSLNHSVDECHMFLTPEKNNQSSQLEEEVQKYAAFVQMVKVFTESVGAAILSMFLGVWSDTHGRKPLVVWPLFGLSLTAMLTVVYAMLDNYGPWWYLLTVIPYSLTGGLSVLFTGLFCFVSDITTTENRSFRLTLLEATLSAASVTGTLLSSYLLKAVGNVNLLLIVAALYVIGYAFTNVYVRESLTGAVQGGIGTVLDLLLVKEMFRECFKRRPNRLRAQLLLLTFANSISIFILYGVFGLDYLYTREKLHWAMQDFTTYLGVNISISFTGSLLGVAVLQKWLRISDLALSIVAFMSSTADYITRAFASRTWHMYLGSGLSLFGGLSSPLIRSMLTKILPVEDIAKVFALMCALEGVAPLISPLLYNALYEYTISVFPGAFFILSSVLTSTCVVMLSFVAYYRSNTSNTTYQTLAVDT